MAQRIPFTDSGFWKYSWAHLVMSMTKSWRWVKQCRLRTWRPRASNKGLRPCPLRTEISPVTLNLLMMLHTVDDEICKAFAIWRWGTLFLKYYTIFLPGTCREFLRGRGSNVKKGQYEGKKYRAKDWIHYYFIFLQEVTYSLQACI